MPGHEARKTIDHQEIRRWAEARGGRPVTVRGTEAESDDGTGVMRIGFNSDFSLKTLEWEDFFDQFEDKDLAFLYQEKTRDGRPSRFFKLVSRE